jgi:hypothetical protein
MNNWSDPAKPMLLSDLKATIEKIESAEYELCGVTYPHVVHPTAKGPQPCANMCGAIVERLDERNNHE